MMLKFTDVIAQSFACAVVTQNGALELKVGMIQSCYLPWRGYFDLIDDVDLFVIYDDVQYTRKDWRNRNRIKTAAGTKWITVPVHFSQRQAVNIQDAKIDYGQTWQRKHIGNITQSYREAPFFNDYSEELFAHLNHRYETISQLNVALISWCMEKLNIHVPLRHASEFQGGGDRNGRIFAILKALECQEYLVGPAAQSYIDEAAYQREGIQLTYKAYKYLPYPQLHGDFDPGVSALDLLFICGPDARKFLKSTEQNIKA